MAEKAAGLAGHNAHAEHPGTAEPIIDLIFVSENKIRQLNHHFLGRKRRTDVVAFDLGRPLHPPESITMDEAENEDIVSGEVYICPAVAAQRAPSYNTELETEIILYMVHGLLHLAGRADDTPANRAAMRQAETQIMGQLRKDYSFPSLLRVQ